MLAPKLAFVLGWLCHRAADRQMKPVFHRADPDCAEDPTDCSVYHDVFIFREVYAGGGQGPYDPRTLQTRLEWPGGDGSRSAGDVEAFVRVALQRALLALHTFIPESNDIDAWLERLIGLRQRFDVDLSRYAEALAHPDPGKVRRFLTETNFYDAGDPIIRLARSLQQGQSDPAIALEGALSEARAGSEYAQALGKGYAYLNAASDFFRQRIGRDALRDRLDVGRPGG
jgi:hypothetical protein